MRLVLHVTIAKVTDIMTIVESFFCQESKTKLFVTF